MSCCTVLGLALLGNRVDWLVVSLGRVFLVGGGCFLVFQVFPITFVCVFACMCTRVGMHNGASQRTACRSSFSFYYVGLGTKQPSAWQQALLLAFTCWAIALDKISFSFWNRIIALCVPYRPWIHDHLLLQPPKGWNHLQEAPFPAPTPCFNSFANQDFHLQRQINPT